MTKKVIIKGAFYTNQKCFIITGNNLCYLTAIFNSKLFRFCFKENFPELLGETRELSKVFFEQIRIKEVSATIENDFKNLIAELQEMKVNGLDTANQELVIERKIATIYNVTEHEFASINSID